MNHGFIIANRSSHAISFIYLFLYLLGIILLQNPWINYGWFKHVFIKTLENNGGSVS